MRVRVQELSDEVSAARVRQRGADERNDSLVSQRIAAHLRAHETVLDGLRDAHRATIERTDFDPEQRTRQGAAWLLAGRCVSLGYALVALLRSGIAVEIAPTARTLHECSSALRIMLESEEHELHRRWLRDGYFSPKMMEQATQRIEQRTAIEMIKQGQAPPGRTDELDRKLYDEWSRIAHNRRSGILDGYRPDLREFVYGAEAEPLRLGVWVGYGTQVLSEVTVTVGATLTKMHGREIWTTLVEPLVRVLQRSQRVHPLDPETLGFAAPDSNER